MLTLRLANYYWTSTARWQAGYSFSAQNENVLLFLDIVGPREVCALALPLGFVDGIYTINGVIFLSSSSLFLWGASAPIDASENLESIVWGKIVFKIVICLIHFEKYCLKEELKSHFYIFFKALIFDKQCKGVLISNIL